MTAVDPESLPRWLDYLPIDEVVPADVNPKGHDIPSIRASINRWGYTSPAEIDERTGKLAAGHGRTEALQDLRAAEATGQIEPPNGIIARDGRWYAPFVRGWASANDDEARAYVVANNRLTEAGGWKIDELRSELERISVSARGLEGVGYSPEQFDAVMALAGGNGNGDNGSGVPQPAGPTLADRFLVPPFSVFDARQGYWQDRKRRWLELGIRSEEGRAHNLLKMSDTVLESQGGRKQPTYVVVGSPTASGEGSRGAMRMDVRAPNRSVPNSNSGNDPAYYWKKQEAERRAGRPLSNEEFEADYYEPDAYVGGTSIFDPVLCEVAYRWWAPAGGLVLDPFAGGSVRGVVAARLDRRYIGVDLSAAQVQANEEQADAILGDRRPLVSWQVGNSLDVVPGLEPADFVFSCPPYFDLERYSDDPADLSNLGSYSEFLDTYRQIVAAAVERLAPDSFACFVVGDIRDSDGAYRGFVPDTIRAFEDAGARFYNDIVLVTSVGSLALRAARIFSGARKVGKAHQNVLVFVKGDPKRAAERCAPVDAADVAEMFGTVILEDARPPEPAAEPDAAPPEPAPAPAAPPSSPAWARGLPIEQLREVARLFREHDGDLPLGAFSAMKENAVAEAASRGELRCWRDGGQLVAAAVVRNSTRPSRFSDFRGVPFVGPPGTTCRRFAVTPGYEEAFVAALGPLDQLDVWQEHPLERWVAARLELAWSATKIKASSELVGVYARLPEAQLDEPDGWALARLDLQFDATEAMGEVEVAAPAWADHYAVYNKRGSWQAVSLRGFGGDPAFIIKPAEMSKKWKDEHPDELGWTVEDTPLFDSLPGLRALVDRLPGAKERVRLMRLAPGDGELSRHADITDPDAGTQPGKFLRIHLPLRTNPDVQFTGWCPDGSQQAAHMAPGEAWWLDTRKPHTAVNRGSTERIHLVVDVAATPELLAMVTTPAPVVAAPPVWAPSSTQGSMEPWTLG